MLQSFNDRLKGPFTWIIVITVSFVFVITGMSFFFTNMGASKSYVAKVGDNEISQQQFQQYSQNATTTAQKRQVLDQLIKQYLIMTAAQKHNLQVPKLALQSAIFTNPMFFDKDGEFSNDKLSQVADYVGGISKLEAILSQNIVASAIPDAIQNTTLLTKNEKTLLDNVYAVSKTVEYVKFAPKSFAEKVKPTDEQLQEYYKQHQKEYVTPAKVSVSYFIITKDDFKSNDKISDQTVERYYKENKDLFKSFDGKTKTTIKSIIKNRKALSNYNLYTQDIDSLKFADLTKKIGKAKTASIIDDDATTIDSVKNSRFFINNNKEAAIAIAQDKTLVYQIDKSTPAEQQTFADVKAKVTKAYRLEKSKELAQTKAEQTLANLKQDKSVKTTVDFKQAEVTSDYEGLPSNFVAYIIANANEKYLSYKDQDNNSYVYKVTASKALKDSELKTPKEVLQNYKDEELNYYLQTIKAATPIKINTQNI